VLDWLLHSAARPTGTITSVEAAVEDVFSGVCRSILAEFVLVSLLGWSQQGGWSSKAADKCLATGTSGYMYMCMYMCMYMYIHSL
jgi:hypothetical protein